MNVRLFQIKWALYLVLSLTYVELLAQPHDPEKLAPSLHKYLNTFRSLRVYGRYPEALQHWLDSVGIKFSKIKSTAQVVEVLASPENLEKLSECQLVDFIDVPNRKAHEEKVLPAWDVSLNRISTLHQYYPGYTGEGMVVSIKEKPFHKDDIDFKGRVILSGEFDEPGTEHASTMATIIAGAGNSTPTAKGVAWKSGIVTSDFDNLLPDDGVELTGLGISVQNHSYGVDIENYYGIESFEYDKHCVEFPEQVHVFSSGNSGAQDGTGVYTGISGFANLTGQFKQSKNTISVGAVDASGKVIPISSRGPAFDGRIKPEVVGLGLGGTSEAAAIVSGISLLIQQAFQDKEDVLPSSSLARATLVNSAHDAGRPEVDFEYGFGIADARNAVKTIVDGHFATGAVSAGEAFVIPVNVPAGSHRLKATLAWTDPEAIPNTNSALLNDLDLTVVHDGTGSIYKPWLLSIFPAVDSLTKPAKRGEDHLNNIEQVTINLPEAGTYSLRVSETGLTSTQKFSLVYEIQSGNEWIYPLGGQTVELGAESTLRWSWSSASDNAWLEYRYAGSPDWQPIALVDAGSEQYQWLPPVSPGLIELRLLTDNEVIQSGTFTLSKPSRVKVGYNCENEFMLTWNTVEGASSYALYTLGDQYLELFQVTTDTFLIIQKSANDNKYFTVVPGFDGLEGLAELTINYELQGTGCYFISFVPEQFLVTDVASFNVKLGTTHKLRQAVLERFHQGVYQPVSSVTSFTSAEFIISDLNPLSGYSNYRMQLTSDFANEILSDEVQILTVKNSDVVLYPNPVRTGEAINIALNDEGVALLQLYDVHGRPVTFTEDNGPVKSINTSGITAGTYILRIQRPDGGEWLRRVVVF